MKTYATSKPTFHAAVSVELLSWVGLLLIVLLANLRMLGFPAAVLAGFVFVAVACIVFSKWIAGSSNVKDMRNFIYIAVLFWVLLDPLQSREGIEDFKNSVAAEAILYVVVFLTTVSLGYCLAPSRKVARVFARISEPSNVSQIVGVVILLYLLGTTPILYYSDWSVDTFLRILLAGYNWDIDPGWRRGALGSESDYLFTICFLILNVTPFLALWALRRIPINPLQKVAFVWIIVSVFLFHFFAGGRRYFAFLVLASMLYLYDSAPKHRRVIWAAYLALALIILLVLMQVQVQFRAAGFADIDVAALETHIGAFQRDNIFYWMLTAVSVMPEQYSFTREIPFVDFLIHPIPRFLWPGKPISEGFPFQRWEDASLTISVIGEFFIAQGLIGVIIAGLAYGWGARNWDELIRIAPDGSIRSLIYYMGGVLFFVVGIRSLSDIVTQWYSVGFVVLLTYLLGKLEHVQRA